MAHVALSGQSCCYLLASLRPAALHQVLCTITSTASLQHFRSLPEPPVRPQGAPLLPPQPELVNKFYAEEAASLAERRKAELHRVRQHFQLWEGDTGSSEVQVAALSQRIRHMAEHMRTHKKDFHSRRGLEAMLNQRRSLLQYLRRKDFDSYAVVLSKLGLRDTYIKRERDFGLSRAARKGGR